jgi:DedD protein
VTPDIAPEQAEPPQQVEPSQQAKTPPQAAPKPASPRPVMPPKPAVRPGERAWIVQVGSFAARANAQALRDRLRKQNFASFVEEVKGSKGKVYRVRVGPELSRDRAERLQKKLAEQAKLTGLVQAYP